MAVSFSPTVIRSLSVKDIRFPTSKEAHGSDAMHKDPDYSCAYVILKTDTKLCGHGFSFTLGRGTQVVVEAIRALSPLIVGRKVEPIFQEFGTVWRELTSETQLRWLGPEKGVMHLAVAAIVNALWDLWAKKEGKPLWKLLSDMEPEKLISAIDFRYITDAITKEEALEMLKSKRHNRGDRENVLLKNGYPAYCTSAGWMGYGDDFIKKRCREAMTAGFTRFKAKVGISIEDDKRRLNLIRKEIGPNRTLMVDANQVWDVPEAISWMKELKDFDILWIEEPTSPDDVLGHAEIAKALRPLGISVATGEHCQNRVMFKQFLQADALQFCQIDTCRLGGVNEILAVYLMAAKFNVPVCPHAGGVGLCEMAQHLAMWDYVALSGSLDNRFVEYVDHLHEHFVNPVKMKGENYVAPSLPGYSTEMKEDSLNTYEFPYGPVWKSQQK